MPEAVLIVDDDPVQGRLLEAMVQRFGYHALLAGCPISTVSACWRACARPASIFRSSCRPLMAASITSCRQCARAPLTSWSSRPTRATAGLPAQRARHGQPTYGAPHLPDRLRRRQLAGAARRHLRLRCPRPRHLEQRRASYCGLAPPQDPKRDLATAKSNQEMREANNPCSFFERLFR